MDPRRVARLLCTSCVPSSDRPIRKSITSVYSSITVVAGPHRSKPPAHRTKDEPSSKLCTATLTMCFVLSSLPVHGR